jgi:hypothetical protein
MRSEREVARPDLGSARIAWRQPREREISIARRVDVALLDEFIGPKY